ncbi:subtilase-type protease inhibitor [Streptomyces sp. NBC_01754]|uniref:SSI family serine proteinase inhibitor n=1 Tax=Streptomyces sp. NBC_01754 TaxID=2975930 RepID=UPI002DD964DA|nr:SSI family serine proteinase inhibitor [Streptomyces sp. NBC_01754]WSC93703.1 subtilase-type protease inhibitor [Streptomyces sp. NBC_01754]
MLRRLTLTAVASLAALTTAAPAATAVTPLLPLPPLPVLQHDRLLSRSDPSGQTRLTVTVSESGNPTADGTFELKCGPAGGSHPEAQRACDLLDEAVDSGKNPFVPTERNAMCTMQAGGPAAARVEGTWHGQPVDARFSRANGCEISRWNNLVPVLPSAR